MKYFFYSLFLLISNSVVSQLSYDSLQDQSGGIADGYGAWGEHLVVEEEAIEVDGKGTIICYHPEGIAQELSTVFFISGWGRPAYTYDKFFYYLSSLGYTVVNIYNTDPGNIVESYQNSLDMILLSKSTYFTDWIATNKVALMGHSYGAGSTIWLGKQLFSDPYNWGEEGRFIFMTAPWYSLLVTPDDLRYYPENVKLVVEVNNDDLSSYPDSTWNTSERAIRAMFQLINIPEDEKDFIRVFSDPGTFEYDSDDNGDMETYSYDANHYVSYTGIEISSTYNTWDALDVYAINRIAHALLDYVFEEQLEAKNTALGNGSSAQIDMGFLTDMSVSDHPVITRSEDEFRYKCNTTWSDFSDGENTWFLQSGCEDSDADGYIDALKLPVFQSLSFVVYPNPAHQSVSLQIQNNNENIELIQVFDTTGKCIIRKEKPSSLVIDIANLAKGSYYLKVQTSTGVGNAVFLKE
jgi:hypothetical protein